ncbi:MAG: cytochrome c [Alphaproteobacteria bacterium]|nr:cytochrome c [Alphaproteobacteria bacterium]
MKKFGIYVLAAGLVAAAATVSLADANEDAVTARRAYFQVVSFNTKPLFGILKGSAEYDAKQAQQLADNLKLMAAVNVDGMWLKGSDSEALKGKTRAKPETFADGSDFNDKFANFRKAINDLASVAGNGKEAMIEKMKAVGASCSACHKEYRNKDF